MLDHGRDEPTGLRVGQRRQGHRERVGLAAAPAGAPGEQLRPCGSHDEERHTGRPVDEVIDEVEQAVVGPLEVLENEHERPLVGERLEEPAPCGECLSASIAVQLGWGFEAHQGAKVPADPLGVSSFERKG